MTALVSLNSNRLKFTGVTLENPHHIEISSGISAVIGPNGAGKTSLAKIIEGGWNFMTNDISTPEDRRLSVKRIEFSDIHSLASFKTEYYQQRFESMSSDGVPTVTDILGERINSNLWRNLSRTLGIEGIESKRVNFLSSGELRKMLIANMLFESPDLLILDNPYIGLDAPSRNILNKAIANMRDEGMSIMLLLASPYDIPEAASQVIPMSGMTIRKPVYRDTDLTIEEFRRKFDYLFDYTTAIDIPLLSNHTPDPVERAEVVNISHCRVKYGDNILLDDVSWHIWQGECWSLSGPNGAGKSTLLSLINADNPQSYSNNITLFGRRRGSGESIWEIKKRIGYISPEKHLYFFAGNNTAIEVAAGGLKETLDNFKPISDADLDKAMRWLKMLKISHLANRKYTTLSFGEQRLVLLVRTLIKKPELMILDEPLHGLDAGRKQLINCIINTMTDLNGATLIYVSHYAGEIPACVSLHKKLKRISQ